MFQKIIRMWNNLLYRLGYERRAKEKQAIDPNVQKYDDIEHINWGAMAISKITNLACYETSFEIQSTSALVEQLTKLCADLTEKRSAIVTTMLGTGDCYIFPSFNRRQKLFHSVLSESRVVIAETDGEEIVRAYAILDSYRPDKGDRVFFLIRIHDLDENGTLTVSYETVDETGQPQYVEKWAKYKDTITQFIGADHIGFGRYKSPVSSREHSEVYGVPLNFGCGEIEKQIKETMKQIQDEFKNGKSVIFTDGRNIQAIKGEDGKEKYEILENIIPLKQIGNTPPQIDIFNPTLRGSEHFEKLKMQLEIYEQQMGLSRGILTENQVMATGTATAVERSNKDTISFIGDVHTALDKGNKETLEADGIFLNIRRDLWEYNSDYYEVFADAAEQWQRLVEAVNAGAIKVDRLTNWLFPEMTQDQVEKEIAEVNSRNDMSIQTAIERSLMQ